LADPPVLILDEPTSGLDPTQIIETRKLIRQLGERHTVLVSSHILSEVEMTCDRAVIIVGGQVAAQGKLAEMVPAGGRLEGRAGCTGVSAPPRPGRPVSRRLRRAHRRQRGARGRRGGAPLERPRATACPARARSARRCAPIRRSGGRGSAHAGG
jgi:hypothetical protein